MNAGICLFLFFASTLGDSTVLYKNSISNAGQLIIDFAESTDSKIEPLTENSKVLDQSTPVSATEDLRSDGLGSEDPNLVESDTQSIILNQNLDDESGVRRLATEDGEGKNESEANTDESKDEDDQTEKVVIDLYKGEKKSVAIDKDPIEHGSAVIVSYCKGKCKEDAKETTIDNKVYSGIKCLTPNTKMKYAYNIAGTKSIYYMFTNPESIDFSGPKYCYYWWTHHYDRKGSKLIHISFARIEDPEAEQDLLFLKAHSVSELVEGKNKQKVNTYFLVLNFSAHTRTSEESKEKIKDYQFIVKKPDVKEKQYNLASSILKCKRASYNEGKYQFDGTKYLFAFGDSLNLIVPAKTLAMEINCEKGEFTDPVDPKLFEKKNGLI